MATGGREFSPKRGTYWERTNIPPGKVILWYNFSRKYVLNSFSRRWESVPTFAKVFVVMVTVIAAFGLGSLFYSKLLEAVWGMESTLWILSLVMVVVSCLFAIKKIFQLSLAGLRKVFLLYCILSICFFVSLAAFDIFGILGIRAEPGLGIIYPLIIWPISILALIILFILTFLGCKSDLWKEK